MKTNTQTMSTRGQSGAEDSTDRYTHTWSVVLLLLLALVTWLLPLSPTLTGLTSTTAVATQTRSPPQPAVYKASCWCPAQWPSHHVAYTNEICAGFLNSINRGEHVNKPNLWRDHPRVIRPEIYKPKESNRRDSQHSTSEAPHPPERTEVNLFLRVTMPLTLFIFALGLKLPHIMWSWLSSFGSINIPQTLAAARAGLTLDADSRRKLHSDLGHATREAAKNSRGLALGYMFIKCLVCLVVVAEIAVLLIITQPELEELQNRPGHASLKSIDTKPSTLDHAEIDTDYENSLMLFCSYPIHQMQNVASYTVQCMFTSTIDKQSAASDLRNLLWSYQALLTAVLTHLAIIAVVNVLSLVTWFSRLVIAQGHGISQSFSLDLRFLMLMSKETDGPLVVRGLAQSLDHAPQGTATSDKAEDRPLMK